MATIDVTTAQAEREMVKQAEAYKSPYERWKEAEGLPTVRGYYVKNLLELQLPPWKSRGDGARPILNPDATGGSTAA